MFRTMKTKNEIVIDVRPRSSFEHAIASTLGVGIVIGGMILLIPEDYALITVATMVYMLIAAVYDTIKKKEALSHLVGTTAGIALPIAIKAAFS